MEIHEQGHAIATRLLCGGWADRVFDNVLTYSGCSASSLAVVDLVGPLFSYAMLWTGALIAAPVAGDARPRPQRPSLRCPSRVLFRRSRWPWSPAPRLTYGFVRRIAGDAIERAGAGGWRCWPRWR
ncbi:hypothetical protein J4732_14065 [Serratia marcescens]|uniref:Uncharacterized protein n=1 Tax=Serratia marcescens TaxID=615 RepID=A0A939NT40_SERMA|nr:hypothetical protein [Serratia marcescens]